MYDDYAHKHIPTGREEGKKKEKMKKGERKGDDMQLITKIYTIV